MKTKLPSLRDGANRWIATFEDETVGDMIAVGDIKVLLTKVLTRQEMKDILEDAGMKDAVGCEDYTGQTLNTYRAELWGTLRDKFPTKMSKNRQLTKPLTTEDNFDQWITEQVQHWRHMTNENVTFDRSSLCAQLFRSDVKEVLPISVQGKLRDIPGLDEMDHDQWSEKVIHFVKTHQEAELALEKQSREVTRKLAQANLEQLKKDKKLKGTYIVRGEAGGSEESTGGKGLGQKVEPTKPGEKSGQSQQNPQPIVLNVPLPQRYHPQAQRNYRRGSGRDRPMTRGRSDVGSERIIKDRQSVECYGCHQLGHTRAECHINP